MVSDEEILRRIKQAADRNSVSVEELLRTAEYMASCMAWGCNPKLILFHGAKGSRDITAILDKIWPR